MRLQGLVALRVLTHIVHLDGLNSGKGRIGLLDLCHEARLGVFGDPLGEVMDATRIVVDLAVAIAHSLEGSTIGGIGVFLLIGALREGGHRLNECRAVQFASVHHEPFLVAHLQGMCHVGLANESTGEEQRQIGIGGLLAGILEQGADLDAVCGLSIQLPALRHHRQRQAHTYHYRHTPFQFFNLLIL